MSRPPHTVPEAMQVLGVADKTIRHMIHSRQLREAGRDAGNRILIDPDSVDAAAVQLGLGTLRAGRIHLTTAEIVQIRAALRDRRR